MDAAVILAVLLIGFSAGLRTFTAPAVAAWAVHVDHLDPGGTPFTFMASHVAVLILSLGALGEYVFDLLPFAPPRIAIPSLIGRIVMGTVAAAVLLSGSHHTPVLCILGGIAAVAGAFAGYKARTGLVAKLGVRDFVIAIPEDLVAIGLSVAAVCLV